MTASIQHVSADLVPFSYDPSGPVALAHLRLLTIPHVNLQGEDAQGVMVVHRVVAEEILEIFKELKQAGFKINKMKLIDDYKANDDESMADNNSSCFCARKITNSENWSIHSYGTAIALNPMINPYVKGDTILPVNATNNVDREKAKDLPGFIGPETECLRIFLKYGWTWGGNFITLKDYHHFEKKIN